MPPILTPEDFQALTGTVLTVADLVPLIAGVESQIDRVAGPLEDMTEIRRGGSSVIILARPTAEIVRIREFDQDVDLAVDDWELATDRRSIYRLASGTTPRPAWWGPVRVDHAPYDNLYERRLVAIKLLQLELGRTPGILGFTEGNWSIQYPNGETWGASRADLLSGLGSIEQPWHFG